jgi:hypothetical protein
MSIDSTNASPARLGRKLMVFAIAFLALGLVKFAVRHHGHGDYADEGSQPYGD